MDKATFGKTRRNQKRRTCVRQSPSLDKPVTKSPDINNAVSATDQRDNVRPTILTDGGGGTDAASTWRRGGRRRARLEALMHSVQAEVLLVGAGAAALPLLLIVVQVEAVVLDQADAEQTQIRPELVHQLVLAAIGGGSGGEVELPAENRREDVELLVVEAERGRRQR